MLNYIFFAAACNADNLGNSPGHLIDKTCFPQASGDSTINDVYIWIFVVLGGIALLFLVVGGMKYALSGGNEQSITTAKNQIKYSLVGLLIAAFGGAITNWVVGQF